MSFIGWIHTILASIALISGAANLSMPKGTARHRWVGRVFGVSMVGLNVTALAIYHFTGHFGLFHGLAIASLATLAVGLYPVLFRRPRRYWLDMHYFAIGSAYAGLLAAFANEIVARVPFLTEAIFGGAASFARIFAVSAVLGQFIALLGMALLLWRYDGTTARLGRRALPAAPNAHGCAGLGDVLLLYAGIALVGNLVTQSAPGAAAGVWQFLGTAGGIATLILAYRRRGAPGELRWLAAWYFLQVFAVLWLAMLGPVEPRAAAAFRASLPFFGLVALGLFLSAELVITGLIGSFLLLAAYQFAGEWFPMSVAMVAGGVLGFAGWRLRPARATALPVAQVAS